MKRNAAFVLTITAFLFQSAVVSAVTTTPPSATLAPSQTLSPTHTATTSATTTPSAEDKQIETIKKNIANTVQEIQKKGHKAAAGYITSIKNSQIVIKDSLDRTTNIKLDPQLTQVFQVVGSSKKELKQTDLAKNMYIIVSGPLLDNTINANVVYVDEEYFVKSGKIVEVNTTDDSLKISTSERDTVTVDIDSRLKVQIMDSKTLELSTITSFTKIKEGDTVHFIYAKTGKETTPNRFDALKVVVIPQEYFIQK